MLVRTALNVARHATMILIPALLVAAVGSLALLATRPVSHSGGSLVDLDIRSLAVESELVVLADVVSSSPAVVTAGPRPGVVTDSYVRPVAVYRGTAPSPLLVRTQGGQTGLTVERAEGEATLQPGQRVVLFLIAYRDEGSARRVYGGFQGRYFVAGDQASNEKQSLLLSELDKMIQAAK